MLQPCKRRLGSNCTFFESRKTPLLYVRHPSIFRKGRMQQSWKFDCSNEMTSQQVNVEKKVISKKQITHSHPGRWHNRPHNQVDSARSISRGVWTNTVVCVGACVHWHDVDVTTKLCFAQLQIDVISDHVITASAGQRERSRSGSVISHFPFVSLFFHFFDHFIVLLFIITNTPFHCCCRKHPR